MEINSQLLHIINTVAGRFIERNNQRPRPFITSKQPILNAIIAYGSTSFSRKVIKLFTSLHDGFPGSNYITL